MGDTVIVQEKVDGTCVAVYKTDEDNIITLNRAGWRCDEAPQEQHRHFNTWAQIHRDRFLYTLGVGEWIVGEWCMVAHGTRYAFGKHEPFFAFDILYDATGSVAKRVLQRDFLYRVKDIFNTPPLLHYETDRKGISPERAYESTHTTLAGVRLDPAEGVVYRVESKNEFNFHGKWVRPRYVAGRYFTPKGEQPLLNWSIENLTTDTYLLQ
jgi:hypothetical protein